MTKQKKNDLVKIDVEIDAEKMEQFERLAKAAGMTKEDYLFRLIQRDIPQIEPKEPFPDGNSLLEWETRSGGKQAIGFRGNKLFRWSRKDGFQPISLIESVQFMREAETGPNDDIATWSNTDTLRRWYGVVIRELKKGGAR